MSVVEFSPPRLIRCGTMFAIMAVGEFGMVYRGTLDNWKGYFHHVVAVKTLKG